MTLSSKRGATLAAALLTPALLAAAGCPETVGEEVRPTSRWDVTLGHRGDGFVAFRAHSARNGDQSGECRDDTCRTTVDDLATLNLTPVPAAGARFRLWEGDPAHNLACPSAAPGPDGTISWTVAATTVCIAVFEAAPSTPSTPTTPGG